ncbi:MAG: hypothetical protein ACERKR_11450 [Deltaproteobacteria bacterium]
MKTLVRLMLISMLMIGVVSAYSAECVNVWRCEVDDDATEAEVEALASKWLKAAKKVKGGERLEAYVYWPVATGDMGETDCLFVVMAPSFEEWGRFWDNYASSEAAEIEVMGEEKVISPQSALWEVVKIK